MKTNLIYESTHALTNTENK